MSCMKDDLLHDLRVICPLTLGVGIIGGYSYKQRPIVLLR